MDLTVTNVGALICCSVLLLALFKKLFPDKKTRDKLKVERIVEHLCDKVLKRESLDWDDFENNPKIRERAIVNMVLKNGDTFAMHCRGHVADALGTNKIIATCDPTLVKELFFEQSTHNKAAREISSGTIFARIRWGAVSRWRALEDTFESFNPCFSRQQFQPICQVHE